MPTANELYRDAALRHQVGLRRYSTGLNRRIARLLEEADAELIEKLRARVAKFASEGKELDYTGRRWQALLADMRAARSAAVGKIRDLSEAELTELGMIEAQKELDLIDSALPIQLDLATVAAERLSAIATSKPFQGKILKDWFKELADTDAARLVQAIQLGMTQGETIDDMVRRVAGTRANQYADGILAISRRNATAIVRTAVNHVSNAAREEVWHANADIIAARIWTSTLDGRTSAVCRARDGHAAPVGDNPLPKGLKPLSPLGAKPPAHFNCRSTMVAYLDGVGMLGDRPTVTDKRTRAKREIDFRRISKETGKPIQQVRKEWADANVGRVPASTTYDEFLRRQPPDFQDSILGKTKGRLFREGGMQLDEFVDKAGNELTLKQLAATRPELFTKAKVKEVGWKDGSETGEWHAAAFSEAPDWLKARVTNDVVPGGVTHALPDTRAHFDPSTRGIDMDGLDRNTGGGASTWRHEYGHALDRELGLESGMSWISHSEPFKKAVEKDGKALWKTHKGTYGTPGYTDDILNRTNPERAEFVAKLAKDLGVNMQDFDDFLTTHTSVNGFQGVGLWASKARALHAWRELDAETFIDALAANDPTAWNKGVLAHLSDLFGALSKNKICDVKKGYPGHSDAYYQNTRAFGGYESLEVFANLTALAGAREPFAWAIVERFAPHLAKAYKEILK